MVTANSIDLATLTEWNQHGKAFQLVDVRQLDEHLEWNIGGIHIPLDEIVRRHQEIMRGVPVIFYCRKGIRSLLAIQRLAYHCPELDMYNLAGGIGRP